MDDDEIRKSAALEDRHWWYAGRRSMLRGLVGPVAPGRALDVGCGSGGNTEVLRDLGWDVTGLEFSPTAAELARSRQLSIVRGDATRLPFADASFDLVMSTDLWEHVADDRTVAAETARVLRPGGRALIAVPCSMALWSGHDVALGHVRRYERNTLRPLIEEAGLEVVSLRSWNVLLRPVAQLRRTRESRRSSTDSEMEETGRLLNAALRATLAIESRLPVESLPGISLVALARKPVR